MNCESLACQQQFPKIDLFKRNSSFFRSTYRKVTPQFDPLNGLHTDSYKLVQYKQSVFDFMFSEVYMGTI